MLRHWVEQATYAAVKEPLGIVLATVNSSGIPSTRVVLQKKIDDLGIVFSTSGRSQKALDLQENPNASCTYWWRETMQQVHCRGSVVKLSKPASDDLFSQRNPSAQAIAHLSHQSQVLSDETALRYQIDQFLKENPLIARPEHWYGYRLEPSSIEFWLGNPDRFHRRIRYMRNNPHESWTWQRLQP
ncbi:UNVERIFIED_CONTAM: hypothetical protein GTU68_061137 [Idotea baltica]|nr:hypothetical protein [Idotea baltica]